MLSDLSAVNDKFYSHHNPSPRVLKCLDLGKGLQYNDFHKSRLNPIPCNVQMLAYHWTWGSPAPEEKPWPCYVKCTKYAIILHRQVSMYFVKALKKVWGWYNVRPLFGVNVKILFDRRPRGNNKKTFFWMSWFWLFPLHFLWIN